jgi:hypothetical protein
MLRSTAQTEFVGKTLDPGGQTTGQNDVYQWTLSACSQGAVDEWRRGMNGLYEQAGYGVALTLTDARRSILPPLAYATTLSSIWIGHLHRRLHSRNAILCAATPSPQAEAALQGLPGYGNNVIHFFDLSERVNAMRWLVSDD